MKFLFLCFLFLICFNVESCKLDKRSMPAIKEVQHSKDYACEKGKDIKSVGDPSSINLPKLASEIYQYSIPTYSELCGVNVNRGNEYHFDSMHGLSETFSHARTFHFMNKDFWDDGLGQANGNIPATLRKYNPKDIGHLKLLVDKEGFPLMRNDWKEGDRLISFDPQKEELTEEPLEPGFYNVYDNYMNQNWIYQNKVSSQFNGNLQTTLTVVSGNFPKAEQAAYNFPNGWFLDEDWGDVRLSAKAFAMLFARAYAPVDGSYQLCKVLEIGNEPWGFKAETYQKIIDGFVEGFQTYYGSDDFKIKLIPAAFQGNHLENKSAANWERANWKDYFGTRLNTTSRCNLNGINIHNYSNDLDDRPFNGWFKERLIAPPEKESSSFLYARNAWVWMKNNMPSKAQNIYASEFGWDTDDNCKEKVNATGVGEAAQGIYTCRALLLYSRMGIIRANVFELLNDEGQSPCQFAYHSSGFYKLENNKIQAKSSLAILQNFIKTFGDLQFKTALIENDEFYLYEVTDGEKDYLVGWLPENINNKNLEQIKKITRLLKYKGTEYTLSPIPVLLN